MCWPWCIVVVLLLVLLLVLVIASSYEPNSTRALLTQGTFDSVSAGILLYVAFVQMLAYEFAEDYKKCGRHWGKKVSLYLAMWTGAAVMAVIGKWL